MGACVSCRGREQATHPLFEGAPAWEQRLPQGNEWMPPPPEPERIYSFDKYEVEKELGRGEVRHRWLFVRQAARQATMPEPPCALPCSEWRM